MNPHLQRAYLLVRQSRYDLAEQELRQALLSEPSDGNAHALLAVCHCEQKRYAEATQEAENGIHHDPENPLAHYALAHVMSRRRHYAEAEQAIREAIRLRPFDGHFFATLSSILIGQHRWQQALEAAEQGLAFDAQDAECLNYRAVALVKLGRTQDAGATLEAALAQHPENALSHANMGWTSLEHNDSKQAMLHFREALRLDPENEWARNGMVHAINARNPIYRILLRYLLWMAKLTPGAQWGIVIGGFVGAQFLGRIARQNPALWPWVLLILVAYFAFVLLTWLGEPAFNLLVRLHPLGRHALSSDQRKGANLFGLLLLSGIVALTAGLLLSNTGGLLAAAACVLLLLPASAIFRCDSGWPRNTMALITVGLFVVAAAACSVLSAESAIRNADHNLGRTLFGLFVAGTFISQFAANYLMMQQKRH